MWRGRGGRRSKAFQKDPDTTIFLLSMRSGAVGINLTAASHVFLLEPAMNPALEDQAIGRAWRMGNTHSVVVVKRFYIHVRLCSLESGLATISESKLCGTLRYEGSALDAIKW